MTTTTTIKRRRGRPAGGGKVVKFDGAIRTMASQGKPVIEIAAFVGVDKASIRRYTKEHGIHLSRQQRAADAELNERNGRLCEMYQNGMTLQQVGDHFGMTRERVRQILNKFDLTERRFWAFKRSGNIELAKHLYELGEPIEEIAEAVGATVATLRHYLEASASYGIRRTNTFWRTVAVTADAERCWEWQGFIGAQGYGKFGWSGGLTSAHRLAFELANGRPAERWVLHKCDNKKCVNPSHLYDGTPQENVRDREERKRGAHHNGNSSKRLNATKAAEIKKRLAAGETQASIAESVGMSLSCVSNIARGRTWGERSHGGPQSSYRRLTSEQADEARNSTRSCASLARDYGVTANTIWRIKHGVTYKKNS